MINANRLWLISTGSARCSGSFHAEMEYSPSHQAIIQMLMLLFFKFSNFLFKLGNGFLLFPDDFLLLLEDFS